MTATSSGEDYNTVKDIASQNQINCVLSSTQIHNQEEASSFILNLRYFHYFRKASFYLAGGTEDQINGDWGRTCHVTESGIEYSQRMSQRSFQSCHLKIEKTFIVSSYQPMQCNNRDYSSRGGLTIYSHEIFMFHNNYLETVFP